MTILRTIVRELVSLFIDDWLFAVLIVAWIAGLAFFIRQGGLMPPHLAPPLLFGGIAVLTLTFVARKSRSLR
jgi:hypothetical protein